MDQHALTVQQFGSTAARYLASPVHSSGADLDRLALLARESRPSNALDLGCGAGHASYALARGGASRVVAYDLSPQMLEVAAAEARARGHRQIEICAGPAERLPFPDTSFDLVVTRYSAHHWSDALAAVHEAARVLQPGGTLIVIDVLAPENALMDTVLQTVEILRDLSHVRDYRESEWRAMFEAANFASPCAHRWRLQMEFDSWVARIGTTPARVDALKVVLDELPSEARDYFAVRGDRSFAVDSGWLKAKKRGLTRIIHEQSALS
jgi:ubiquinone/menaquinone biosynthesis C-methylase UbiE